MNKESPPFTWPHGAKAAVALSYDDAMPCHFDLVGPALEQYGLRGTFYTPIRETLADDAEAWRDLVRRGHELGNHTIFHPCRRETPIPNDWIRAWNNLVSFDEDRFRSELHVANVVLRLLDGKTERTYGNTCHDVLIGPRENPQRIEPIIAEMFVAGRGPCTNRPADPATADLGGLGTIRGDGVGFTAWRAFIDSALATSGLALFTFHGVAAEVRQLHVAAAEHQQLLAYLRDNQDRVWTAPVIEIARWIRQHR